MNPCKKGEGGSPCGRVRIVDGVAAPYLYGTDCATCYAYATEPAARAAWGGTGDVVAAPPPQTRRVAVADSTATGPPEPCQHDGGSVPPKERERLQLGHLKAWRYCEHPERPLGRFVCPCSGCGPACRGYLSESATAEVKPDPIPVAPAAPAFAPKDGDPPCGVVVGVYRWPSLVALQIEAIRDTCGPVPILIASDDPDITHQVDAICRRYPNVWHWPNHVRIGHTGGDVSAFFKGAIWGAARGLRVVAKLSQRFVVTAPRWLQDGAADLLASGLPLASQQCRGSQRFDLRTESCILDVAAWSRPEVLDRIRPRAYWTDSPNGLCAETILYRVLVDLLGGIYWPWSLISEERKERREGVLWHNSHGGDDYAKLAAKYGVRLDPTFHVEGWQAERKRGEYLYG